MPAGSPLDPHIEAARDSSTFVLVIGNVLNKKSKFIFHKRFVYYVRNRCGSLLISKTVSLLANGYSGPMNLTTINLIYYMHEVLKDCKTLKIR